MITGEQVECWLSGECDERFIPKDTIKIPDERYRTVMRYLGTQVNKGIPLKGDLRTRETVYSVEGGPIAIYPGKRMWVSPKVEQGIKNTLDDRMNPIR